MVTGAWPARSHVYLQLTIHVYHGEMTSPFLKKSVSVINGMKDITAGGLPTHFLKTVK